MALTAAQAEAAEWSGRRGDDIDRSYTRTAGGTSYDAGSLVVQIRAGSKESDTLVASSNEDDTSDTVALITTTGTDLTATDPVIAWQCAKDEYEKIPAGDRYWIGFDVTVDGKAREILRHTWSVLDQTAVRSAP
jgi:hypothetical protein